MLHRTCAAQSLTRRLLNSRDLQLQEELRDLDRQIASFTSNSSLGSEIIIKLILQYSLVRRSEGVKRKLKWRGGGVGEVNGTERDAARGYVWDIANGFGVAAGDGGCERVGAVLNFSGKSDIARKKAGSLARVQWC